MSHLLHLLRRFVSGSPASRPLEGPAASKVAGAPVQNISGKVSRIGLAYVNDVRATTYYAIVLEGGRRLEFIVRCADLSAFANDLALTTSGDFVYISLKPVQQGELQLTGFRNTAL